jgi:hypothetical protein
LDPGQLQFHGPLPLTLEAVPALQRLRVGAVPVGTPFAEPHWPFTGADASCTAEQVAVVPPLLPAHVHDHPLLPVVTVDAVPALQRLVVGALERLVPFEAPHAPLTAVVVAASVA